MIKKLFMFHMGFIILNAIGIIAMLLVSICSVGNNQINMKLLVAFIFGIILGHIFLISMTEKYHDAGLLK